MGEADFSFTYRAIMYYLIKKNKKNKDRKKNIGDIHIQEKQKLRDRIDNQNNHFQNLLGKLDRIYHHMKPKMYIE